MPYRDTWGRSRRAYDHLGIVVESEAELIKLLLTYEGEVNRRFSGIYSSVLSECPNDGEFKSDLPHRVRSMWEANFARWMRFHQIPYDYECFRFRLNNGMSYVPDFRACSSGIWIEVKGIWMQGAKEKVHQFMDEYPNHRIIVLDEEYYRMLTPVPGWGK